jgi:hypothetical protein
MAPKTSLGKYRKEITDCGTESVPKFIEREIGIRPQTRIKNKRAKKASKELMDYALNS